MSYKLKSCSLFWRQCADNLPSYDFVHNLPLFAGGAAQINACGFNAFMSHQIGEQGNVTELFQKVLCVAMPYAPSEPHGGIKGRFFEGGINRPRKHIHLRFFQQFCRKKRRGFCEVAKFSAKDFLACKRGLLRLKYIISSFFKFFETSRLFAHSFENAVRVYRGWKVLSFFLQPRLRGAGMPGASLILSAEEARLMLNVVFS